MNKMPTKSEVGKKGGIATRDNHISLCPLCGAPVKNQYLSDTGRKGGETTLQKRGHGFYSQIGRLGGRGNTREKRNKGVPLPRPPSKENGIEVTPPC